MFERPYLPSEPTWCQSFDPALKRSLFGKHVIQIANVGLSSELAREKIWSRIHLIPLLQAEEDRDQARRYFADKAREKELLGTETKVYNSDR